jgi:CelD/BcsL family acetyltransferase involved in cellulose biosynthesis
MYLRPNDLLIWRTIEWACQQGFTKYCLGGAHSFLRKSGGSIVPICRYRLDRTFLHRRDLKENIRARARSLMDGAPACVVQPFRRLLVKT